MSERGRPKKRRVVVELYHRSESGRLLPSGVLVTEYGQGRRGGALAPSEGGRERRAALATLAEVMATER